MRKLLKILRDAKRKYWYLKRRKLNADEFKNFPVFPPELTKNIENNVNLIKGDNWRFFRETRKFNDAYLAMPFDPHLFLFAPNVCVIDYLYNNIGTDKTILDMASGMGFLSVYVKHLGYTVYNYDTFTQVRESTIKKFMEKNGISDTLKDKKELLQLKPDIISLISLPYDQLDLDFIEELFKTCNYFLIDGWYDHLFSKFKYSFTLAKKYPGLLSVYKKTDNNA